MELQERRIVRGIASLAAVTALTLALGLSLAGVSAAQNAQPAQSEQKPYTVKDGKVDKATYNGWRRYTESCLRCHGPDGAGSSYAPSLVDSLKQMSEDQFKEVVVNGRKNVNTAAENVMPAFGEVEDVMLYLDDIYAYLKARSDGVVGRGRPEKIGED
ncbi:MAG TPA: cytochrome c [Stellaceae bacterium]|nr:cytochrome c [Stellaceae bacterium]